MAQYEYSEVYSQFDWAPLALPGVASLLRSAGVPAGRRVGRDTAGHKPTGRGVSASALDALRAERAEEVKRWQREGCGHLYVYTRGPGDAVVGGWIRQIFRDFGAAPLPTIRWFRSVYRDEDAVTVAREGAVFERERAVYGVARLGIVPEAIALNVAAGLLADVVAHECAHVLIDRGLMPGAGHAEAMEEPYASVFGRRVGHQLAAGCQRLAYGHLGPARSRLRMAG